MSDRILTDDTEITQFLSSLFAGCAGLIEIRPLPPGPVNPPRFFKTVAEAAQHVLSINGSANVYVGAATRFRANGTKADVLDIPGLWADCDDAVSVGKAKDFSRKPTMLARRFHLTAESRGCHRGFLQTVPRP